MMFPLFFVFVLVCPLLAEAGPLKRLLLHDDISISEAIQKLDANVALLNSSFQMALTNLNTSLQSEITSLKTALQAEQKQRCQIGRVGFNECHPCSEDIPIHFNPQFSQAPAVFFALDGMDIDHTSNIRISTSVKGITTAGATLTVGTWADTHLYSTHINWIACPK